MRDIAELDEEGAEDELLDKALRDLEWSRIVASVAIRCRGPLRDRLIRLPLAADAEVARAALAETREAEGLERAGEPIPIIEAAEIGATLHHLEKGGVLDGAALFGLAKAAGAARALRRFLQGRRSQAPSLAAACATDPALDGLEADLRDAIEPDGRLSDRASPELAERRREIAGLRGRLVKRMEELIVKHAELLSDRFYTQREGRYVLPVRADAHERLQGIVHGSSQSGATIFVEPRELVPLGNRLKMAEVERDREERRLLLLFTETARAHLRALREAAEAIDRADLRQASARLGRDLGGSVPILDEAPRLDLKEARHPLLLLEGIEVVPNDLPLSTRQALVISGPNAGGKTVSLKIFGLAALMARAALPVAAAEGSRVGFFSQIFTDIGDEQSLSRSLSTFSAQLRSLAMMLERAGPGSLVLLDEVAGGTDPEEGAALACAVVEAVTERGAALVVTTHYELLKAQAERSEQLRNASVGFDAEAMAPTFHLHLDLPGASGALSIARRFGLPEGVLGRAEALLPKDARELDEALRSLAQRSAQIDREREEAEADRRAARRAREEAEARLQAAKERESRTIGEEAEKLVRALRDARGELRRARTRVRKIKADEAKLAVAQKQIEVVAKEIKEEGLLDLHERRGGPEDASAEARGEPVEGEALTVGDRVWIAHLRAEGEVVEAPAQGKVRVSAGPATLRVALDGLRLLKRRGGAAAGPESAASSSPRPSPRLRPDPSPSQGSRDLEEGELAPRASRDNTVDLRGLRVEEALALTESFLDRAYGASEPVAYLLHGFGSGALKDAVRRHLQQLGRYVRRFRPGTLEEGGERVTVAYLK